MAQARRPPTRPRIDHLHNVQIDYNSPPLGRGSDAVVYQGQWHAPVAVKELHDLLVAPDVASRDEFIKKFVDECERMRELCHVNVVQFFGTVLARSGAPALVTEKLATTLEKRYETSDMSLAQMVKIFLDITAGLTCIHSHGIVHRDLKPSNVLLTGSAQPRAKIADVGLAKRLHGDDLGAVYLKSRCPGTLVYMPPEAVSETAKYDRSLDVFSCGVLFLATLCRKGPSGHLMAMERYVQLADGSRREIPEIQRRKQDVDAIAADHPLKNVIRRCLENDKRLRPTAAQLHVELLGIAERLGIPHQENKDHTACFLAEKELLHSQNQERLREKDGAIAEKDRRLTENERQLTEKDQEIANNERQIANNEQQLSEKDQQLAERDQQIANNERQLVEKDVSISSERQNVRDLRKALASRDRELAQLQETLDEVLRSTGAHTEKSSARVQPQARNLLSPRFEGRLDSIEAQQHFAFMDKVRRYNQQLDSSRRGAVSRLFTEKAEFGEWEHFECLPKDIDGLFFTTVHGEELFLASHSRSQGCFICSTTDVTHWHTIQPPPHVDHPHGLLSHNNQLYVFCCRKKSHDPECHLHVFQYTGDQDALSHNTTQSSSTPPWRQLPNARCPVRQWQPAIFGDGNRLVLAGGWDGSKSLPLVTEYCLDTNQWVQSTRYPDLPSPLQQAHPVKVKGDVHLVGGLIAVDGKWSSSPTSITTCEIKQDREGKSRTWRTDILPSLPLTAPGACNLFGSVAVAGGKKDGKYASDVFVLDLKSREWLHLPSLKTVCSQTSLVVFKHHLLAFGGCNSNFQWSDLSQKLEI